MHNMHDIHNMHNMHNEHDMNIDSIYNYPPGGTAIQNINNIHTVLIFIEEGIYIIRIESLRHIVHNIFNNAHNMPSINVIHNIHNITAAS